MEIKGNVYTLYTTFDTFHYANATEVCTLLFELVSDRIFPLI